MNEPKVSSFNPKSLDVATDWSVKKDRNGVMVMVDGKNCFVCHDTESALETLSALVEARDSGSSEAIRLLASQFQSGQFGTRHGYLMVPLVGPVGFVLWPGLKCASICF